MMAACAPVLRLMNEDEKLFFHLATHIAPVLKGLRSSTLVCFRSHTAYDRAWQRQKDLVLSQLPLAFYPLDSDQGHRRLFFYDPEALSHTLNQQAVQQLLATRGYQMMDSVYALLTQLACRFRETCPHEVGLFLGYPVADVYHFIHGGKPCLKTSYWKVYTCNDQVQETFDALDQERNRILNALEQGQSVYHIWQDLLAS